MPGRRACLSPARCLAYLSLRDRQAGIPVFMWPCLSEEPCTSTILPAPMCTRERAFGERGRINTEVSASLSLSLILSPSLSLVLPTLSSLHLLSGRGLSTSRPQNHAIHALIAATLALAAKPPSPPPPLPPSLSPSLHPCLPTYLSLSLSLCLSLLQRNLPSPKSTSLIGDSGACRRMQ